MILIYPLLVASNINPTVIPGVVKALEKYMIVYQLDSIMQDSQRLAGLTLQKVNNKLFNVREDKTEQISSYLSSEMLLEQSIDPTLKTGTDAPEDDKKDASVGVDMKMDQKTFSLEPTWIRIERIAPSTTNAAPVKYSDVLGIKVLPVIVKSDAKLVHLLSYDVQVNKLLRNLIILGRKVEVNYGRVMATISSKIHKYTLGFFGRKDEPRPVSGDPYEDIIMKKTYWAARSKESGDLDRIFVMTNLSDFRTNFFDDPRKMMKLRKMGWGSIIVGDDVNKKVSFCMKPFTGMCSTLSYSMLFQSYDQYEVYKDLEEIKRSSASIFKINLKQMHKMIGVSEAMEKIDEFAADIIARKKQRSQLNEIKEIVNENVFSFAHKFISTGPSSLKILLKNAVSDLNIVPKELESDSFIMKIGKKLDPKFMQSYQLSERVFSNTIPELKDHPNALKSISLLAPVITYIKNAGEKAGIPTSSLKEVIMELVRLYRERRRRNLMSGEAMPEEYKAGFRSVMSILFICMIFPLTFLALAKKGVVTTMKSAGVDTEGLPGFWDMLGNATTNVTKFLASAAEEIFQFIVIIVKSIFSTLTGSEMSPIQKDEAKTLVEKFLYMVQEVKGGHAEKWGQEGVMFVSYIMMLIIFFFALRAFRDTVKGEKVSPYYTKDYAPESGTSKSFTPLISK